MKKEMSGDVLSGGERPPMAAGYGFGFMGDGQGTGDPDRFLHGCFYLKKHLTWLPVACQGFFQPIFDFNETGRHEPDHFYVIMADLNLTALR